MWFLFGEQESFAVAPQILFSTHRNIIAVPDSASMILHMNNFDHKNAMIYTINRWAEITNIQKVEIND